jgi:hypothetical protein
MQAEFRGANPGSFGPLPTPSQKPVPHDKLVSMHISAPQQFPGVFEAGGSTHKELGFGLRGSPSGSQRQPSSLTLGPGGRLRSKPSLVLGKRGFGNSAASLPANRQEQHFGQHTNGKAPGIVKAHALGQPRDSLASISFGVRARAREDTAGAGPRTGDVGIIEDATGLSRNQ